MREVLVCSIAILAVAQFLNDWVDFRGRRAPSLIDMAAYGVAIWRISLADQRKIAPGAFASIFVVVALAAAGPKYTPALVLTALALHILRLKDANLRAAGALLLALATNELWGKALFAVFASEFVAFDAQLVGALVQLSNPDAVWQGNLVSIDPTHAIVVEEKCASFSNVSLALLCWVVVTKFERSRWVASDLIVAAVIVGTQVCFNIGRMYLMVLSPASYMYWHFGTGAEIFSVGASAAALSLAYAGATRARSE